MTRAYKLALETRPFNEVLILEFIMKYSRSVALMRSSKLKVMTRYSGHKADA